MHVMVLGGGVTGLATAWYLACDGHEVTVVERNAEVALESSYANGGQLSYSYVAPLAGPGVLSKLPQWLTQPHSPVQFRPRADPDQWRWLLKFVLACTRAQSELATRRLVALSFLSRDLMRDLLNREPTLSFDYAKTGKLVVYRNEDSFASARRLLHFQRSLGCEQHVLTARECTAAEPSLDGLGLNLAGGIFTPSEETADCYKFCVGLAAKLRSKKVRLLLGTEVTSLRADRGRRAHRITVHANGREIAADQVVVCAGAASPDLLRPLGIKIPLYPLKGYSLTAQILARDAAPHMSVTDFDRKIVYARLGDRLRIAGMADIAGRDATPDPSRIESLRSEAARAFPLAGDYARAQAWCGLRPATPTSTPVIGATRFANLWLNLGQGALGFTLALGSGLLISELVTGRRPSVPLDGFAVPS
ncbi:D-amino acid dehydrogenase [Paraburkholderia strydomiana]|jgi:D-amino-acid dehydrogenase|uniref:D-amino acid dehydrogenase n=2 Tax=Paraburkholderia strydomiana TaxID=1245417 RepID=A0ABW9CA56_9BURK